MTSTEFAYWLQGFFEMSDAKILDEKQTQIVKDHLKLVFEKVTPERTDYKVDLDTPIDSEFWTYIKDLQCRVGGVETGRLPSSSTLTGIKYC